MVRASCGPGGGRRRATAVHAACRGEGATTDWGAAHREHAIHGCDAGRALEAERLVEGLRVLPRVASRAHTVRGELRAGRQDGGAARRATAVHTQRAGERARLQIGRRGGPHLKHAFHVIDAGRVEAKRLVEGSRALPRVAQAGHTVRGASCGPGGGRRRATAVHAACRGEGATAEWGQSTGRRALRT